MRTRLGATGWLLALAVAAAAACGDDDGLLGDAAAGDAADVDGGSAGSGSGGNGASGGGGSNPTASACDDCDESASCDESAATPRCVCPPGFEHEGDQMSPCVDLDECDLGEDDCDRNASCTNTEGSYECECDEGYEGDGESCEDIDECDDDPCDENASCENTEGSYECDCDDGFEGDGESCDDIDECDDDPCDEYASCENTEGSYECECDEGFVGDGESCACDLEGTFAALAEIDAEWDAVMLGDDVLLSAGSDTTVSWSIRRHVLNDDGDLEVEITPCGGTQSDLCSPYYEAAFGQFVPDSTWDAAEMPTFSSVIEISDPRPGDDFEGPMESALLGLDIDDPFGDWPDAQDDTDFTWIDHDGDDDQWDGSPGVNLTPKPLGTTTHVRLTGTSETCDDLPYEGVPIPPFGTNRAAYIMTGDRSQANLEGVIESCDVIGGKLGGPDECRGEDNDDDVPCFNGRMRNCVRDDGMACSSGEVAAFDDSLNQPGTRILASRFVMERVDDDITCAEVRAHDFPPIPDQD